MREFFRAIAIQRAHNDLLRRPNLDSRGDNVYAHKHGDNSHYADIGVH
jgi:hypothetical protein